MPFFLLILLKDYVEVQYVCFVFLMFKIQLFWFNLISSFVTTDEKYLIKMIPSIKCVKFLNIQMFVRKAIDISCRPGGRLVDQRLEHTDTQQCTNSNNSKIQRTPPESKTVSVGKSALLSISIPIKDTTIYKI